MSSSFNPLSDLAYISMTSAFLCLCAGPDKVLLVSSTQTVVEFTPSAGLATVCNMEIKVSACLEMWYL